MTSKSVPAGIVGAMNSKSSDPLPEPSVVIVYGVVPLTNVTKDGAGGSDGPHGELPAARWQTPSAPDARPISGARCTMYVAFARAFCTRTLMSASNVP